VKAGQPVHATDAVAGPAQLILITVGNVVNGIAMIISVYIFKGREIRFKECHLR
jgi:hypothetical protein